MEPLELTDDDEIRISLIASVTTTINYHFRIERSPGIIEHVPVDVAHSAGDRTSETTTFHPGGGTIVSVLASALVKPGEAYTVVHVVRFGANHAVLLQGYIDSAGGLSSDHLGRTWEGQGRLVTNEASSTLVNNTALTRTVTVPTNARWRFHGGHAFQADDVARTLTVVADDGTAGQHLGLWLADSIAAATRAYFPFAPAASTRSIMSPMMLEEGDRILITWAAGGASAGGTARSSLNVQEWIVP